MFKNLLKTSFRSISRSRLFSAINIVGLAISMSLCLLVITVITEIKSYDDFHEDGDSIYRVITHRSFLDANTTHFATTSLAMLPHLQEEFPEVTEVVGFRSGFSGDMESSTKILPLSGLYMDASFFDVFSLPLEKGNPTTALQTPFSIVLTPESSQRFFGDEDPVGKVLTLKDGDTYQVTGLLAEIPKNTHLKFDALVSLSTRTSLEARGGLGRSMMDWSDIYINYVFIKVRPDAALEQIENRLNEIVKPVLESDERTSMQFSLQRLDNIMTGPQLSNQLGISIPPVMLLVLAILAALIMLTASFNYTNLSLARGIRRAKEVGIRKVVGAKRTQVIWQFMIESLLLAFMALGIGYILFYFLRDLFIGLAPEMQQLVALEISPALWLRFVAFATVVGLLSGIFPSLVLSKIQTLNALRDSSAIKLFRHVNLRKALLIIQFTLSLVFINGTYIISKQYQFVQEFDLGFDTENVYNIAVQGNDVERMKTEFSALPEVSGISFSQFIPSTGTSSSIWIKHGDSADSLNVNQLGIDENYLDLHNFDLASGENFVAKQATGADHSIIVNEKFLRLIGIESPDEALGQIIKVEGREAQIRGVVRDFYYHRISKEIGPFIFTQNMRTPGWANLKLQTADVPAAMAKIESAWQRVDPLHELNGQFFDDRIEMAYQEFSIMSKVIGFVSVLAISIASLGLLGMAVYLIETRMKEVSIRKVLGASERTLVHLLSKSFVRMLVLASLIALPLTYFIFDKAILANFVNRTGIGFMELAVGVSIIGLISVITIGSQIYKAAVSNPVNQLRAD